MQVKLKVELTYFPHNGELLISIPDHIASDSYARQCYIDAIIHGMFKVHTEIIKREFAEPEVDTWCKYTFDIFDANLNVAFPCFTQLPDSNERGLEYWLWENYTNEMSSALDYFESKNCYGSAYITVSRRVQAGWTVIIRRKNLDE